MFQIIGNTLVAVGGVWVAVSSLVIYLLGALFWLGTLVSFIYAGSIIGAILWIMFGTAVTAIVFGLLAMPVTLIGMGFMSLGEKLKQPANSSS